MSNLLGKSWIAPPNVGSTVIGWAANGRAMKNYTASELRTLLQTGYELSVKDYGAVGDGTTDDGPAFRAWWDSLNVQTGPTRGYIPPGKYNLTSLTARLDLLIDDLTIEGAGSASTVLLKGATYDLFYKASATGQTSNFTMKGFTVQGQGASKALYGASGNAAELYYIDNLVLEDIKITDLSSLAFAARYCDRIFVNNCSFQRIGRGGLNIADSRQSMTTNCLFWKLGDDSISLHEMENAFVGGSHTVSNCLFYMAQGIRGVGGRNIAVTNNNFEFMAGHAFDVTSNAYPDNEGVNSGMNVTFTNNVIKDTFNNAYTTSHNSSRRIIRLGSLAVNAGSLDDYPGYPDDTGVFVRPEAYYTTYDSTGTTAVAPNINYVIANNTVIQSLAETANFSDLGFGDFFGYEGEEVDPAVTRANLLNVDFLLLEGGLNNVIVSNNVITGVDTAFQIASGAGYAPKLRNIVISDNIIQDCIQFVIDTQSGLTTDPDGLDIIFKGNLVDLDPYFSNSNRTAGGAWTSIAANTAGLFIGIRGNNVSQIRVFSNTFKNIAGVTSVTHFNNTYLCNPTTIGTLDAGNLGVGIVPYGEQVILLDSDPASATYGAIVNTMVTTATAMPATGKYVTGHFVKNSAPAVAGSASSKYVIDGWRRLTTGTGHVADTDWAEVRTLTGT